MARHHIGLPSLRGTLSRYAERYDLLEVRLDDGPLPKPATLRSWRKSVPPSFVFSVVMPRAVGELRPSAELDDGLARASAAARELEARCVVIPTPPSVTPTEVNRKRLSNLVDRIPHDAVTIAWEPHGLWEAEEAQRLANKLGILLVVDPAREPAAPAPMAYFRIRGLGESSRLSPAALDRVAAELQDRREAYVIIESVGPGAVAQALRTRASRRSPSVRTPGPVMRPHATLHAEDEEQ